ncbi:MAG: hypothetical protein RLW62_21285 [Gammaproteobacteria bacterium]
MRSSDGCRAARRLVGTLLLAGAVAAGAQQAADPAQLQQALNRAQGLLRQLAQERTRLEAEVAAGKAALAASERQFAREQRAREELAVELELAARAKSKLDSRLENTGERLARVEERLADVVEKYKALAAEYRDTRAAKAATEDELALTERALDEARTRNEALFQANRELIERYLEKGPWEALLQREPLTGLKQVELENLEQEYRHRIEDQRLAGEQPPPPAPVD